MTTERMEVERTIGAAPAEIFAVLSDPHGHVTIDASGMLQSADGDPVRAVGDTFVVHMDREALGDRPIGKYDATVVITAFEPDRRIEWTPSLEHGYCFGYLLEPIDDGCRTTSYCDWSERAAQGRQHEGFPLISVATLRASLGILARTVEPR